MAENRKQTDETFGPDSPDFSFKKGKISVVGAPARDTIDPAKTSANSKTAYPLNNK